MKRTAKIRYAIVGLGHLAQVAILPAFRHARRSELAALVSGDSAKGRVLSKKYGVPAYNYDDFEVAVEKENDRCGFYRSAEYTASPIHRARRKGKRPCIV